MQAIWLSLYVKCIFLYEERSSNISRGRIRGPAIRQPHFLMVRKMSHLSRHHWTKCVAVGYTLCSIHKQTWHSQHLFSITCHHLPIYTSKNNVFSLILERIFLKLYFAISFPIMTFSVTTFSCNRFFPIYAGNSSRISHFNKLITECVVRLCKIVRRALHRESPSKKVWLDRGQESKFNDPRASRLPEVIGRTQNSRRRQDVVVKGSAYAVGRPREKQTRGTCRWNDILNFHSIVNGPLIILREGSRYKFSGPSNFHIVYKFSGTRNIADFETQVPDFTLG
jgi:hypothetical protein